MEEIIEECRDKNLFFSTDIKGAIETSDMIFIAVNMTHQEDGIGAGEASDLAYVESYARSIAKYAKENTIVVEKSTIPVKTADIIDKILNSPKNQSNQNNSKFYPF